VCQQGQRARQQEGPTGTGCWCWRAVSDACRSLLTGCFWFTCCKQHRCNK
jgi:hypothetical protein